MYWNYSRSKLAKIAPEKENENKYTSCKVYIVFMIVVFTTFTGVTIYFVYYNWSLIKNNVCCIKFSTDKETKIWWLNAIPLNVIPLIEHINGRNKTNKY